MHYSTSAYQASMQFLTLADAVLVCVFPVVPDFLTRYFQKIVNNECPMADKIYSRQTNLRYFHVRLKKRVWPPHDCRNVIPQHQRNLGNLPSPDDLRNKLAIGILQDIGKKRILIISWLIFWKSRVKSTQFVEPSLRWIYTITPLILKTLYRISGMNSAKTRLRTWWAFFLGLDTLTFHSIKMKIYHKV